MRYAIENSARYLLFFAEYGIIQDKYVNQFEVNEEVADSDNQYRIYDTEGTYAAKRDYTEEVGQKEFCGANSDKQSFWFAFLAFWSPLFGIILYLVYEDKKPLRAQSLKNGMIAGIVTRIVLIIMIFALGLLPALNSAKQTNELYDTILSDYYNSLLNS